MTKYHFISQLPCIFIIFKGLKFRVLSFESFYAYPCQWRLNFCAIRLSEATIYPRIFSWVAVDGEILKCERETSNRHDPFAVAIRKDGIMVGHVPQKISTICSLFLRRCGVIQCEITGRQLSHYQYCLNHPHAVASNTLITP